MDRPEQERAESSRNGDEQTAGAVRGGGARGATGAKGRCVAEKSVNGMYEWRLKAPNGRVVAVSPAHFRTAAEAVRACADLGDGGAEQLARITHENEGIGWVWSVPGPYGRPLARSPRAYERYATCQNAFRKFMALLVGPGAPPGPAGQREAEPSHERRSSSLPGSDPLPELLPEPGPEPLPGARPELRPHPPAEEESAFRYGF